MIYIQFTEENTQPFFELLERCQNIEQSLIHHPEGNVFVHSVQVLGHAFRESIDIDLILAAMLHDIGKYEDSKGHEKIALKWLESHVSVKTLWLIEHHMRIWGLILGEMKRYGKVQYLIGHPWLPELILLARWDKLGRNPNKKIAYNKENIMERFNKCAKKHFEK